MKHLRHVVPAVLLLILAMIPIRHMAWSSYFPMHDDTQIARVVAMGNALKDGQFPVRMVSDLGYGYGYPIFNFYAPLPYYAGGSLYALGLTGLTAAKIMFVLGFLLATVSAYCMGVYAYGRVGGVIASVLYTFAPYHSVQLYVRGAIGEMWAYGFLPFVVLGFLLLVKERYISGRYFLALGVVGVLLSHLITAYVMILALIVSLIVMLVIPKLSDRRRKLGIEAGKGLIIGLTLSSFYLLPALFERSYTSVQGFLWDATDFRDHFVCPIQFWWSVWGYGGSAPGCVDGLSFELGKTHIISAVGAFFLSLLPWFPKRAGSIIRWSIVASAIFIFLMLSGSEFIWNLIPESGYIQYPWRLLSFSALFISLAGAGAFTLFRRKAVRVLLGTFAAVSVMVLNTDIFRPQFVYEKPISSFEAREELRFRASKISDEYLPPFVPRPERYADIPTYPILPIEGVRVEYEVLESDYKMMRVYAEREQLIPLYIADFPGWHYYNNSIEFDPPIVDGFPQASLTKDLNTIEIRFKDTPIRRISIIISMVSLGLLLLAYVTKIQR